MEIIVIPLRERVCDSCLSSNMELLWEYKHTTRTRDKRWLFHVCNVICKDCGFVFTSPVVDELFLIDYYSNSFLKFFDQRLDYDVDKRVSVINQFCSNRTVYLEIGANIKTDFHRQISSLFDDVLTIEPNTETIDGYTTFEDIDIKASCVAHYFVMEHIPNLAHFLGFCFKALGEDGVMICEVPSLEKYHEYISPLILFEHVNHFTPNTLRHIASNYGFEEIFSSSNMCSRPFGFVSVFRKSVIKVKPINEYNANRRAFMLGQDSASEIFIRIQNAREFILSNSVLKILIWAANETTNRLLTNFALTKNATLIDSDIRKKDYFEPDYKVYLPNEALLQIQEADAIMICTELHAEDIVKLLAATYEKKFSSDKIFIVDKV